MELNSSFSTEVDQSTTTVDNLDGSTVEIETDEFYHTQSIALGDSSDADDDLAVVAGGESVSSGTESLATGTVTVSLTDAGGVTSTDVTAEFTASAVDDSSAFAVADSYALADGADITVSTTTNSTDTIITPDSTAMSGSSSSSVTAIDFEQPDTAEDVLSDMDGAPAPEDDADPDTASGDAEQELGSIATLSVEAVVYDESSLVQIDAMVLTLDDLAMVSAVVTAEAG